METIAHMLRKSDLYLQDVLEDIECGDFGNIDIKDGNGWTPLMIAAQNNNLLAIDKLIEAGADVNYKDNSNITALFYAVAFQKKESIKLLMDKGADPLLRVDGLSLLEDAIMECAPLVLECILNTAKLKEIKIPTFFFISALSTLKKFRCEASEKIIESYSKPLNNRFEDIGYDVECLPKRFFCPVSFYVMEDPITIPASGMTYNRLSLWQWFNSEDNKDKSEVRCPLTNVLIPREQLEVPTNLSLLTEIETAVVSIEVSCTISV